MKAPSRFALFAICALLLSIPPLQAQDKKTTDKAKDVLEKLVDKVTEAANKTESKSKSLWKRAKENMQMDRAEYMKKAGSALVTMEAEIQGLSESGAAVTSRDYFKTRIEAMKQHLDYCQRDLARLKDAPSEEAFRVKQKGVDRTLGALGDNIDLAKEEAGL